MCGDEAARYQVTRALAFPTIAVPNARTLPLPLLFHPRALSTGAQVQCNVADYDDDLTVVVDSRRERTTLFITLLPDSFA